MRSAVIGNGYVGKRIFAALHGPTKIVLRNDDIEQELAEYKPTYVFNCAGYTGIPNVDACEVYKEKTLRDNLILPQLLTKLCRKMCIKLVHISSGCVYDGLGKEWSEHDKPNFMGSFYSLTKVLAEESVQAYPQHYIMRIRMPFSEVDERQNLLTKLSGYQRLVNFTNSLSHIDDAVKAIISLAYNQAPYGIYNVTNPGKVTTREIADMLGVQKDWVTRDEFREMVFAPRSECVLDTSKMQALVKIRDIKEALQQSIRLFRKGV